MSDFKRIDPEKLTGNVFKMLEKDWMLITAGNKDSFNTMTAAWGGLGILWHKKVSYCFVRPSRYTYEFMEKSNLYTLAFFDSKYKNALTICGTKSGRDCDKISEAGLTPLEDKTGSIYFKESNLVLINKKIYFQDLQPEKFLCPEIESNYPEKDYHRMYIGEILAAYIKN